jgi:hypothetical protein
MFLFYSGLRKNEAMGLSKYLPKVSLRKAGAGGSTGSTG